MAATPGAEKGSVGLVAAVAIGIGGMVGAGIFSILGIVAEVAGGAMWIAFLIGGGVAMLATYSYAKLGARYPSAGGAAQFLIQGYGDTTFCGAVNVFMWLGYIVSLALYAHAFGSYAVAMVTPHGDPWVIKLVAVAAVALLTLVNALGTKSVSRSETLIVAIKVAILALFVMGGIWFIQPDRIGPGSWNPPETWLFAAGILFIGYEGFGLVANAAGGMANPSKLLPRALYTSVVIVMVLYLTVSVTVLGNLSPAQMAASQEYALAEAARPFLGQLGFTLVAIAALFSTASAINATLFGASNICYLIARDGELPAGLARGEWRHATGGLLVTAGLVVGFVLLFDLSGIAMMGSSAFLLVYAAVNGAHLRITSETGARRPIVIASILACLVMFVILAVYTAREQPAALVAVAVLALASLGAEALYRRSGRRLKALDPAAPAP